MGDFSTSSRLVSRGGGPLIAGLYDLGKTIGQGHFAVVKLARHVFTQEQVAVKVIDKNNLDAVSKHHLMNEVRCMKLVQHPHIVRLYEVIDTNSKLFLILELGDYDMHDFILKHDKGCPEPLAQQYFCQIITAINYCHKLHVVHRDLKPENVVFFEKLGMVKLTDFGFSNFFEPGEHLRTACGSLAYSAPEILLGDAYDAPAVDVWSLGVILFMLVCGRLPFQEANDPETLTKILDCRYSMPETLSNPCKNLITRMLVKDPQKRSSLEEIAASPWVQAGDRGHAEMLPLVVRHHLPESAHTTIVEQMVNGHIGTEDAILAALENDEYNYLSATYYLLAERVLSSYREEQAKSLAERASRIEVPDEAPLNDGDGAAASGSSTRGSSRCRSRSNSFRAAVRRPCTILKEESEEELSTYLRSSSRQSSRFYLSRDDSSSSDGAEAVLGSPSALGPAPIGRPKGVDHLLAHNRSTGSSSLFFEELSPIAEHWPSTTSGVPSVTVECNERTTNPNEQTFEMSKRIACRSRSGSAVQTPKVRLVRRNSSPSVSMFGGGGQSSRDRVSPQALQELLEMTRLTGRRAASPDSVRSSRSPSPPCSSSGRASPASLLTRLKPAAALAGGMRKLSSSPHLLGICEEGEEEGGGSNFGVGANSLGSSDLGPAGSHDGIARTNRSASTGGVFHKGDVPASVLAAASHSAFSASASATKAQAAAASPFQTLSPHSAPTLAACQKATIALPLLTSSPLPTSAPPSTRHVAAPSSSSQMTTYSAVRMIRPRQAVVSPDVCRRYEQRFVTRTRRSTSCSSSETSDDEERRLTMLSSTRHCKRGGTGNGDRRDDYDDNGGVAGPSNGALSSGGPHSSGAGGGAPGGSTAGSSGTAGSATGGGSGKASDEAKSWQMTLLDSPLTPLRPIPEMTHLSADKGGRIRARFMSRSQTAERVIADWTSGGGCDFFDCPCGSATFIAATPPRTLANIDEDEPRKEYTEWMRRIVRTKSDDGICRSDASLLITHDSYIEEEEGVVALSCSPLLASSSSSLSEHEYRNEESGRSSRDSSFLSEDSGLSVARRRRKTRRRRTKSGKFSDCTRQRSPAVEHKSNSSSYVSSWVENVSAMYVVS